MHRWASGYVRVRGELLVGFVGFVGAIQASSSLSSSSSSLGNAPEVGGVANFRWQCLSFSEFGCGSRRAGSGKLLGDGPLGLGGPSMVMRHQSEHTIAVVQW
ncbi:uncharacterized protein LY79DRAFT_411014 [Colletotrichum navitas]|uniref:Uncharacterized protein n=1 Tax=Colletotrichum navitas TaxID=681940 RepID=A0AAD8V0N9_9PEZI|nr:uncharacterized protein LY79DRAFT_411014 [Colletotrichum navitas]KAK1573480.1 hypothetical protein LY79DRAFT_411014 [Colletotrichum navitas]